MRLQKHVRSKIRQLIHRGMSSCNNKLPYLILLDVRSRYLVSIFSRADAAIEHIPTGEWPSLDPGGGRQQTVQTHHRLPQHVSPGNSISGLSLASPELFFLVASLFYSFLLPSSGPSSFSSPPLSAIVFYISFPKSGVFLQSVMNMLCLFSFSFKVPSHQMFRGPYLALYEYEGDLAGIFIFIFLLRFYFAIMFG